MGTLLFTRGIPQRACLDELATTRPDLVGALHREYLEAGADLIETLRSAPTGCASRRSASPTDAARLNRRAAQVAREARDVSGRDAWVAGSDRPARARPPAAPPPRRGGDPGRLPRADRRAARGRRRPARVRDLLRPRPPAAGRRRGPGAARPADRRLDDLRRGPGRRRRHHARGRGRGAAARRRRRDRRQLRRRARWPASTRWRRSARPAAGDPPARSCPTPACRSASRASSSTPRSRRTSASMCRGCWTPARGSSAAAAARRRSTSRRCAQALDARAPAERRHRRSPRAAAPSAPSRRPRRAPPLVRARPARRSAERAAPPRLGHALAEGRFVVCVEIDPPRSGPHRAHDRGRPPAARGRRRPRQHQRLGDGARAHGRDGRRLRHPARPRPRVPRPLHDARPQPDGARVGAARRARARRAQHPRADRRPAAHRRLPDRHGRLGRRLDRAHRDPHPPQPRRGPGRQAHRPAGRRSRSPARSTRPPPTRRPSGTASSASSTPAPT